MGAEIAADEPLGAMDCDPFRPAVTGDGHVDGAPLPLRQTPDGKGRAVAERGAGAARQRCSRGVLDGSFRGAADGVHAAVDAMQPTAPSNRIVAEADLG
jgi:hypothetical protein